MKVEVMILLISLKFWSTVSLGCSFVLGINCLMLLYEFNSGDAPLVLSNVLAGDGELALKFLSL
jgi:hypothetical protein